MQLRSVAEETNPNDPTTSLANSYGVIGHMGCQRRETESMDSKPLTCLPKTRNVKVEVSSKPAAPRPAVGVEGDAPMADAHHSSAQPSQDVANGLN